MGYIYTNHSNGVMGYEYALKRIFIAFADLYHDRMHGEQPDLPCGRIQDHRPNRFRRCEAQVLRRLIGLKTKGEIRREYGIASARAADVKQQSTRIRVFG